MVATTTGPEMMLVGGGGVTGVGGGRRTTGRLFSIWTSTGISGLLIGLRTSSDARADGAVGATTTGIDDVSVASGQFKYDVCVTRDSSRLSQYLMALTTFANE